MEKTKLYIASTIGELNKKGNYDYDPNRSMKIHINHSESTFKAAEEARLKKDEERAYVLYMRYIDIYQKVKTSRAYKKDADHYSLLLGTKKVTDAIGEAEKLSQSLKQRYEAAKIEIKSAESENNTSAQTNGLILPKNNASSSKVKPQPEEKSAELIPKDAKSIDCGILRKIQFSKSIQEHRVLIIDIRNEKSFETSHVRYEDCINIPSQLITPGVICERIQTGITNTDHLKLWKKRAEYELIVMIDWFCEETDLDDQRHPLRNLFDALHKWEQNIFLRHAPVVLSGGFSDWVEFYPQLTTNPKIEIPKKEKPGVVSITSLSDVNFSALLSPNKGSNDLGNHQNIANSDPSPDVLSSSNGGDDGGQYAETTSSTAPLVNGDIFANWKISNASTAILSSAFQKDTINDAEPITAKPTQPEPRKGVPVVNRTTKPGSNKDLTPSPKILDDWDTIFSSVESSSGQESSAAPQIYTNPLPKPDATDKSPEEPSILNSSILDMQSRLREAKKKKESDAAKRKELEEKVKLLELEQEMKRLEIEATEEENRRKKAEKELADKMRGLRTNKTQDIVPNHSQSEVSEKSDTTDQLSASNKGADTTSQKQTKEENLNGETSKPSVIPPEKSNNVLKGGRPLPELTKRIVIPPSTGKSDAESVINPHKEDPSLKNISNASVIPPSNVTKESSAKPVSTGSNQIPKLASVTKPAIKDTKQPVAQPPEKPIPSRDTKPVTNTSQASTKPTTLAGPGVSPNQNVTPSPSRVAKPGPPVTPPVKPTPSINQLVKPAAPVKPTPSVTQPVKPTAPVTQPVVKPRPLPTPQPSKPLPKTAIGTSKEDGIHDKNKLTLSTSLPVNWEKRLDKSTGRYFYLDHSTQSTHWNLPSHVNVKRPTKIVPLKDQPSSSSGGMKRSSSTPNIAQLVDAPPKPLKPLVNRSSKPILSSQTVDDLSDPPDVYARNLAQLHPNFGGRGPGQCGLFNLGNTCYMNSVLQCMFSTSLLAKYFLENSYKQDMNRENFLGSGGEITDGFAVLMKAVWNGKFKNVTPRDFRNTIGRFNSRFSSYTQQDSQELLLFLMDGLHEDLNMIKKREYKEEADNDKMADGDAAKMAWQFHKRLNESIIVELFQGQFKAVTQCLHCRKTSRKFDVFMYLSIPLPSKGSCSISDCFDKFSEAEKMSGDNKWFCPNCKQDRDAVRKMEIWKLPHVLLIHFKRFSFSGRWGDKLQTNVKFPTTDLDINKYVIGPKSKAYNLYAVSHHHGATMDSGHYVASCKNPIDGNWYKYDDHEVSKSSVPSGSSAYILCYSSLPHTLNIPT